MIDLTPLFREAAARKESNGWTRDRCYAVAIVVSHTIDYENGFSGPFGQVVDLDEADQVGTGENVIVGHIAPRTRKTSPNHLATWVDIDDAFYCGKNYVDIWGDNDTVAHVWTVAPVVFVDSAYASAVRKKMDALGVITIAVDDPQSRFALDTDALLMMFPDESIAFEADDSEGISFSDFLFWTI